MQHGDVSCANRAHVMFRNKIREIVMDSDIDKDKYYTSQESETKRSHAHLRDSLPFQSRQSWQIITLTWGTLIMQIGWPIATRPAIKHGSEQKSPFPTCWAWPLSTVTSFYLHVVGRKISHNFQLTLIREMLAQAGHKPQPPMPVGRQAQASTNILRLDTSQ